MEHERMLDSQRKMIEFCGDEQRQRTVIAITHHCGRWRLYAGFLGMATKPICSGETENFIFAWEGMLFKLYSKQPLTFEPSGLVRRRVWTGAVSRVRDQPSALEQVGHFIHVLAEDPKPVPPYPGIVDEDPAFESLIYAAQVSQSTGNTHVVYVDWRAVEMLELFFRELTVTIQRLRREAVEAAVKARADGQIINLFEDDEEEPENDEE